MGWAMSMVPTTRRRTSEEKAQCHLKEQHEIRWSWECFVFCHVLPRVPKFHGLAKQQRTFPKDTSCFGSWMWTKWKTMKVHLV